MNLIDIPLIAPIAEWIWGNDENELVSPEICLSQIPFNITMGCLSQVITKGLGIAIIIGSCLNKTPIMMNIWNSKSASGISRSSLYGEVIVYANGFFYGLLENHPFTAYGENFALLLQNVIIIVMAWHLSNNASSTSSSDNKVTTQEQMIVGSTSILYLFIVMIVLPEQLRYLLMASMWPILLYARGSQVIQTMSVQHTGSLSIFTTGLNLAGSLARIGTTLKETGDMSVIFGFILSAMTNVIMFIQYFYYLDNTNKLFNNKQQQQEEDEKEKKTQ